MQEIPTETRTSKKVVVAVVVAFVVLAGFLFSLSRYYRLAGKAGERISHQMLESQAVDTVKLESDYRANLKKIATEYLVIASDASDMMSEQFLSRTRQAGKAIIDLAVPAGLKDQHLKTVLILAKIEEQVKNGGVDDIEPDLNQLRQVVNNL